MEEVFGRYLLDYYKGKDCFEITEREDGFISCTPIERYFRGYFSWPDSERIAIRYAKGKVLDIGCGAGRHSLFLQRNNLNVLGIDPSDKAIEVSNARGVKKTKKIGYKQVEDLKGSFDTILLLGNNFGLFENPKKAIKMLNRLYSITNNKGIILSGSRNPYETKNETNLEYFKKNRQKGKLLGQLKLRLKYREKTSDWFNFMLVSPKEMKQIFDKTKWSFKKIIKKNKKDFVGLFKK
ncbi:hypothetical protein C9439_07260 [archaeon SCG-AAA382B04]|nr:hypothetical protein C9439_07260 [archaeon SCG-AAA382B04]